MIPIGTDVTISVIVPVYNVEKHLKQCVDSLLQNKSDAYEIILIDDGSTDGSPALCDELEQNCDRIRVIHQPNGGLAAARNTGIDAARGRYVCFVDSDDYADDGYLDSAEEFAAQGDDIFCFPYYVNNEQAGSERSRPLAELSSAAPAKAVRALEENGGLNMAWNKLYRRDFLEKEPRSRFLVHSEPGEDLIFNCGCFVKAQRVSLINKPFYHWVRRGEDTLANRFRRDLNEKNMTFIDYRNRLYRELGMDQTDLALLSKGNLAYIFSCIPNMYRGKNKFPRRDRISFYREIIASGDVALWVDNAASDAKLHRQFQRLYKTRSPFIMDAWYSKALWARRTFNGIWQKIRK